MTTLSQLRKFIPLEDPSERGDYILIGIWLLFMIGLPIAYWTIGEKAVPVGITTAAILQGSAVFYIVQRQWGMRRALQVLAVVAVVTWGAEFVGHRTGFPFGEYSYTDVLQPQIGGVPLLIPIAWFMLLPPSWVIAQMIVGERDTLGRKLAFIVTSAAALTAWDLFLDPQMVAWGFWEWAQPGGYFGIPWVNYGGWLLTAALVTFLANPPRLSVMPLALIYGCVWFLQGFGQAFFWNQVGPALVGCVGMGGLLLLAVYRHRARQ